MNDDIFRTYKAGLSASDTLGRGQVGSWNSNNINVSGLSLGQRRHNLIQRMGLGIVFGSAGTI